MHKDWEERQVSRQGTDRKDFYYRKGLMWKERLLITFNILSQNLLRGIVPQGNRTSGRQTNPGHIEHQANNYTGTFGQIGSKIRANTA